jgi:hypothetical protein
MRYLFGFLSGALGAIAGWFPLGLLVINLMPDRDLDTVVMAFFVIGPVGGVIGLCIGLWLFTKLGLVRAPAADGRPGPHVSRPFAIVILAIAVGMACWSGYEFFGSP